jgi:hypothetical protein
MKALKFTLVKTIVAVSLLIGLSNAALARTSVYVGFGVGHSGFRRSYHPRRHRVYRHNRCFRQPRRHFRPHRKTIILGGRYCYDRGPDYYVVAPPTIIRKTPVVIEKQTVVVQPQRFDESTLELNKKLQYKKGELLKKLETGNKEQRMEAIKELAGFSFDDKVRYALEDVLLSDPDAQLRKEAARSFGKVKNTKALAALEKARVEDSSEDVRKEADQSIKKLEGN